MNPSHPSTWSDENRSFLTGDNALYIARVYTNYLKNPTSVSPEWRQYFKSLGEEETEAGLAPISWTPFYATDLLSESCSYSAGVV